MDIVIKDWMKEYFRDNESLSELVLFAYFCNLKKETITISYEEIEKETNIKMSATAYLLRLLIVRKLIQKEKRGTYKITAKEFLDYLEQENNKIETPNDGVSPLNNTIETPNDGVSPKNRPSNDASNLNLNLNDNYNFNDNHLSFKSKLKLNNLSIHKNLNDQDIYNKEILISNSLEKENSCKRKSENLADTLFLEFWEAYPRAKNRAIRVNKEKCLNKYKHFTHLQKTHKAIMDTLEYLKTTQQWQENDGQFIPMTYTFLNSKIWEQEDIVAMIQQKEEIKAQEEAEEQETIKAHEQYMKNFERNNRLLQYAFLCQDGITKETAREEDKALFEEFDPTKEERRKRYLEQRYYDIDNEVERAIQVEFGYFKQQQKPQANVDGVSCLGDLLKLEVINNGNDNTRK